MYRKLFLSCFPYLFSLLFSFCFCFLSFLYLFFLFTIFPLTGGRCVESFFLSCFPYFFFVFLFLFCFYPKQIKVVFPILFYLSYIESGVCCFAVFLSLPLFFFVFLFPSSYLTHLFFPCILFPPHRRPSYV